MSLETLVADLSSPTATVRLSALEQLGAVGAEQAAGAVDVLLKSDDDLREGLEDFSEMGFDDRDDADFQVPFELAEAARRSIVKLVEAHEAAVGALLEAPELCRISRADVRDSGGSNISLRSSLIVALPPAFGP